LTEEKVVQFSYRVRSPRKDIQTQLVSNGKVVYSSKHRFVVPCEMIIIKPKLKPQDIGSEITVNVIETASTVNIIEKEMLQVE
jgi:hypothetical protein